MRWKDGRLVDPSLAVKQIATCGCGDHAGSARSPRLALCAEVGELARLHEAGLLMSYLGLIPSEDASGEKRRQGAITKIGSSARSSLTTYCPTRECL